MIQECLEAIERVIQVAQNVILETGGSLDYDKFQREATAQYPGIARSDLLAIMQFLQRLAPSVFSRQTDLDIVDLSRVDMVGELSYQYSVAKELLHTARSQGMSSEPRDAINCLKETTRILAATVQLMGKIKGKDEVEEFERAVYEVLDEADVTLRDKVLNRLEGLDPAAQLSETPH